MMRFRLLGPLEIRAEEGWRGIGAPKWRSVLATLLIGAGQMVPADVLISEVWWGDTPPAKAANLISIYVLRLRRLMDDADSGLLVTRAPGYQLRVTSFETDAALFETMVRDGRRALSGGDPQGAARQLTEALALWYGRPFADVPATPMVEAEAERLTELRLGAIELRITAELACGEHAQAVAEIRRLLADHPLQEGLWLLLMQALDGAGRHAEALEVYGQARNAISGRLGVDPGAELRQLHAALLAKDGAGLRGSISVGTVKPRPSQPEPSQPEPSQPEPSQPEPSQPEASQPEVRPPEPRPPGPGAAGAEDARSPVGAGSAKGAPRSRPARGARPAARAPAQLPADIADFTGRDVQVQRLCGLLSGAGASGDPGAVRITVVAGAGGLGKTSLAVHAAHRVRPEFPDGQLYVDLLGAVSQPLPAGDVLARFLRDLGVDGRDIPVDEDERAARYRTTLAGRRMLIVLDNARDAAQVRPLLPGTASSAVLVTTRSRMPDLASTRLVDLNVLDAGEALALFVKVVGGERAAAEPEAAAELLDACAGLPLAIRICAARLATRSGWTIRAMANRLRDEHRRLDEMRAGDLAVRASFQVSFASLPATCAPGGVDPARAFCLLGLWPGPSISAAAAAALFGAPEYLAADALEVLVDTYLLESTGPDRYQFHDLLRVYASERALADLAADVRAAAVGRMLDWYMRTADAAALAVSPHRYDLPLDAAATEAGTPPLRFAGIEDALGWYDDERVNLVAATRQAANCGLHEIAWRLPAPLFTVFNRRGNWADLLTTHRVALDSARQVGNRRGEAWVLNNLGEALGYTRDTAGLDYLEQALSIRREIGDRMGEAQTASNLADAYVVLGRTKEALDLLHRAVDLSRQVGFRYAEGAALNNLGEAFLDLDRPEEAIGFLRQARQTFDEINLPTGTGYALHNLGRAYLQLGHDAAALDCLLQAVTVHRGTGDRRREAFTLRYLASAQDRAGHPADAGAARTLAVAILDDLGDTAQAAEVRAEQ